MKQCKLNEIIYVTGIITLIRNVFLCNSYKNTSNFIISHYKIVNNSLNNTV